jgi:hypothetical protein
VVLTPGDMQILRCAQDDKQKKGRQTEKRTTNKNG